MSTIIAVASQKGGVGKTTTAVNLAAAFGLSGRRCLVCDLDPQANATTGLGVSQRREIGIGHVLLQPTLADCAVVRDAATLVDILPAGGPMRRVESVLAQNPSANLLKGLLQQFGHYFMVLVDCPPSLGPLTVAALGAVSGVIVPMQCEFYAMQGLAQVAGATERIRELRNAQLQMKGIVFTMFDHDLSLGTEVMDEVRAFFGDKVFDTLIPRDVAVSEAPSHGQPVIQYAPRSRGARAYIELAREILSRGA